MVEAVRQSLVSDLPRVLDSRLPIRKLFDQTPAFMGRYFWLEDGLSEVDQHDRARSAVWNKLTQGHSDDSTVLTLLLCVAAASTPKSVLSDKSAATLVRRIRKNGLQPDRASAWITEHAPEQHQSDYARLWQDFLLEAQSTLRSDRDTQLRDALALLRRECNVRTD